MNPNYPSSGDPRAVAVHRRLEIQTLLSDNQRLAASHVALRQDVLDAEQDIRRLSAAALSIKSERDVQALQLRERMIKLEAEARSLEGINAELDGVRSDVNELRSGRELMLDKLRDVEGELGARKKDLQKLDEIKDQIGILRREVQRGRAAVDFERKLQLYNSEAEDVMEKHLVSLARESEKLRSEVANAEKRGMVTAVPASNPGPDYYGNFDPMYAGNSLPDPYAIAKVDEFMEISSQ